MADDDARQSDSHLGDERIESHVDARHPTSRVSPLPAGAMPPPALLLALLLAAFEGHDLAKQQMTGFGGMLSIEVDGGHQAAEKVADSLKVFLLATSLGGVESLVSQPSATSHHGLSREERLLIALRDVIYDKTWEGLREDLNSRRDRKPYVIKLATRIDDDLARIEKLESYENENGINLADFLPEFEP